MRTLGLLLSIAACCCLAVPCAAQALDAGREVRSLIEVRVTGPAQMQQLLAMDLDLAGCRTPLLAQRRVEVLRDVEAVRPRLLSRLGALVACTAAAEYVLPVTLVRPRVRCA